MEVSISKDYNVRNMAKLHLNSHSLEVKSFYSLIIGSGAAGLNCALHLVGQGVPARKIAILTEKLGGGTSFNTGSDKQTYYKLSIIGDQEDSPYQMAKDFSKGGAMHGDIALIESNNSLREFFHLIQLGVPFPHDKYGGYVGYKTDYDPRQRATSIGPLTSQKMCQCLLNALKNKFVPIFDKHYVIDLLTVFNGNIQKVIGLIALNYENLSKSRNLKNIIEKVKIFLADNIILATGGPAGLYKHSVYPKSQWGSLGLAINVGCILQNLTESQFGLASTKFRWNLSGSYQQVIPRYYSIDKNHREKEFLEQYFPSFNLLSKSIFLKGYQWPFNSERIQNYGSSLIDLAVYYETEIRKNMVFLDFRKNPNNYDEKKLYSEAKEYLKNSNVFAATPIERLEKLNPDAIELYKNHDIDLWEEPLEIAVCNQHLNGGIKGDIWWETNIKNLFAIGEANGSHGIHRPGGAALNSGQVGGLRASQKIAHNSETYPLPKLTPFTEIIRNKLSSQIDEIESIINDNRGKGITPLEVIGQIRNRMAEFGSIIRPLKGLAEEIKNVDKELQDLHEKIQLDNNQEIIDYFKIKDALKTQFFFLNSILDYHKSYGKSRGSYLILREETEKKFKERFITPTGDLQQLRFITSERDLKDKIQTIQNSGEKLKITWEKVRPIPTDYGWFENTWKRFKEEDIFK